MPGALSTDILTSSQLAFVAERPPEPPRGRTGRPAYSNREFLPGIPRVLRSGYRWLKGFRRLRHRVDRTTASFEAFVCLAVLALCVRHLVSQSRTGAPARWRHFGQAAF